MLLFPLGTLVATVGALDSVPVLDFERSLRRHASGDWGELDEDDRRENERALREGCRLLSQYITTGGTRFWIITEWDRSATTVLLPEEY